MPRLTASDRMMEVAMNTKTRSGNYFEDFRLGQEIVHATPRTVTDGDIALFTPQAEQGRQDGRRLRALDRH